ncbi:hypothetical protein PUN4_910037 [Paraburkholderia unamae]|nr:hypothetical protein PUN4_910037 [Paraburkholderia unamae]
MRIQHIIAAASRKRLHLLNTQLTAYFVLGTNHTIAGKQAMHVHANQTQIGFPKHPQPRPDASTAHFRNGLCPFSSLCFVKHFRAEFKKRRIPAATGLSTIFESIVPRSDS